LGALFAVLFLVCSTLAGSIQATTGEDETKSKSSIDRMVTVGAAVGRFPNAENKGSNGQFFRLFWDKPSEFDFRVSGGRQHRFGESTLGAGASYGQFLPNNFKVTAGFGVSTGELAPEWTASVSIRRPFRKVPISLGYLHDHWESGARHDRVSLGAERWFKHVILQGALRYNWNDPGDQTGWGGTIGVSYYRWKDLYVGAGWNFGKVRYQPVGPVTVLVDYDARGYYLYFSKWFRKKWGINTRLGYAEEPEYYGITASWFTEW
jgi:YaiO family outer membrane protein